MNEPNMPTTCRPPIGPPAPRSERGAALVISLVMLLVMTALGVSSMQTTSLQERMAGNQRVRSIAFERAETALRAGETAAENVTAAMDFDGTAGRYSPASGSTPRWEDAGTNWATVEAASDNEYIVERLGQVPRDRSCALNSPVPPGCFVTLYRVSGRAEVQNTGARSTLQSTYKAP